MNDYELGQIVRSNAGRDKGDLFIVMAMDELYLFLADGKNRRLELPKRKKKKHTQATKVIADDLSNKIHHGEKITNADIRNSLKILRQNLDSL